MASIRATEPTNHLRRMLARRRRFWQGHPISGLPEIGDSMHKSAKADLCGRRSQSLARIGCAGSDKSGRSSACRKTRRSILSGARAFDLLVLAYVALLAGVL